MVVKKDIILFLNILQIQILNSSAASPTFEYTPEEEAQIQANNKAGLYDKTAETILDLYQKNKRTTFSPITQSGENELQFNAYTPNGNFDFSDGFKIFNTAAQTVTGFANFINDQKQRKQENEQYIKALQPRANYNINEQGINNIPIYKGGGTTKQNPPKVYTDPALYNKAAQNYNDSLALYNYTKLQKKVEPKSKLDFLLSPIAELKIKDEGMAEQKGTFESIIKRNKSVNGNIREDGTRYGNSRLWSLGQNDTEHQILYEEANKIIKNSNGRIQYSNSAGSPDLVHPYIHNSAMWRGYGNNNDYSNTYPKQPVKYQPQRTVNTTNNTPQTFKQINKNTLQIIPNTSQLPKNTHPTTRMQTLHPVNIGADNPQVVMKGQSINLPEPILPQQHGKPIYGPGSTIIGYSGNDMQFKPAYQYTGAPNNVHNLQDKTLLSDPEALKKYIAARDSGYKFKKGGSVRLKFKKYSNNYQ